MTAPRELHDRWTADEPRFVPTLRRVLLRALGSRRRVLLIATLVTAALVAHRVRRGPLYEVSLEFRVEEGEVSSQHAPPPPRDIREHIANVALSRHHVEQLMRRHGVNERWLAVDRDGAIAEFRKDLSVSVAQNYFIYERSTDDPPRTAQVTVSFVSPDLQLTRGVVNDIADALRGETAKRTVDLERSRAFFQSELEAARARRSRLQADVAFVAGKGETAALADRARAKGRLAALRAELDAAILNEAALERRAKELEFGASAEQSTLGLRFTLADEHVATYAPPLASDDILVRTVATFAVVLLLAAVAVGAFDDRIQSAGDVEWWRLPLFGTLRSFPGDDMASQRARVHRPEVPR